MYPWKVVGFKRWKNDDGKERVRLYVERALQVASENEEGAGMETAQLYYSPQYCKYDPVLGHLIIPQNGRFGIDNIIVVGDIANLVG